MLRLGTPDRHLGRLAMAVALLAAVLGLSLSSCHKRGTEAAKSDSYEIDKKYERGPVTFTVKVSKKEITIADRLALLLEARAHEDYDVELPKFGDKLEQFGIVDYQSPPPKLIGQGNILVQKIYQLEPFLSGDYRIPAMKVSFRKKGDEKAERHELESEEITIKVKSLLPEKVAELKIKEIAPPVDLPRRGGVWLSGGISLAVLAAAGGALWLWRRRRTKGALVFQVPAHELAYRELEKLLAEKLIEKGERKAFYRRLSDILRHYIENRFGLHAPERTTEEFLSDLRETDALARPHKELLKVFLNHCDLVKFAEHQPTNEEVQKTFDACKRFIAETEAPSSEPAAAA